MIRHSTSWLALATLAWTPAANGQIAGTWNGSLLVAGIELEIVIHFEETDSGIRGLLDVPAQGQSSLPLADISFTPPAITFQRVTPLGALSFEGRLQGDSINGRVSQSGIEGTFGVKRVAETRAPEPARGAKAAERPDLERTFLDPCTVVGVAGSVFCGRYGVPENRTTQSGRRIDLHVVVLPALERDSEAGPVVFLAGGPGGAATQMAPAVGVLFRDVRRSFDVLLVDQRGTGESNPLQCGFEDFEALARAMLLLDVDDEVVTACRDSLDADLRQYTTPVAMDDLDDVRAALGYERVNLYGMSYGTRAALVYARRHPDRVRTMTLQGVDPTTRQLPVAVAADAQAALDLVLQSCANDGDCAARYGDVAATLAGVTERLRGHPVEVQAANDDAAWGGTLRITDGMFAGALRLMMYTGQGGGRIPGVVASAASGDFLPLVDAIRPLLVNLGATLHFGAFLSVTCAEDLQGLDWEAVRAASTGTVLGDRMALNHQRLCRLWPTGSITSSYHLPVRSDVPTLLFSGSADPVTPPGAAQEAATYLPRSVQVTVPNAGHADAVGSCESRIVAEFIRAGTTEGLDTGCVVPRPTGFPSPSSRGGQAVL